MEWIRRSFMAASCCYIFLHFTPLTQFFCCFYYHYSCSYCLFVLERKNFRCRRKNFRKFSMGEDILFYSLYFFAFHELELMGVWNNWLEFSWMVAVKAKFGMKILLNLNIVVNELNNAELIFFIVFEWLNVIADWVHWTYRFVGDSTFGWSIGI